MNVISHWVAAILGHFSDQKRSQNDAADAAMKVNTMIGSPCRRSPRKNSVSKDEDGRRQDFAQLVQKPGARPTAL
jgi:hypothetical protein